MPTSIEKSNDNTFLQILAIAIGLAASLYGLKKAHDWDSAERKRNKRQERRKSNARQEERIYVAGSQATTITPEKKPGNDATSTARQDGQNDEMQRYDSTTDSGYNTPPGYDADKHHLVKKWSTGITHPINGEHTPPVKQLNSLFSSSENVDGDNAVSPLQLESTAAQFGSKG